MVTAESSCILTNIYAKDRNFFQDEELKGGNKFVENDIASQGSNENSLLKLTKELSTTLKKVK